MPLWENAVRVYSLELLEALACAVHRLEDALDAGCPEEMGGLGIPGRA